MVATSEFPLGSGGVDQPVERALRYLLPTSPVATASVDIGHVGVRFELFLAGDLAIAASGHEGDSGERAMRTCTLRTLRAMARGLMVSGVGSSAPTIASAAGHTFSQVGYRFQAPNTMTFSGSCSIGFARRCECCTVTVTGAVSYSLEVTAMPSVGRPVEITQPAQARTWFLRHEEELASIGVVVLVAVPIAPGQLVGGEAG